ncbi:hypothetical protein PV325_011348 [Microctonus aethiopoides]|uniref:Uncharacterized protein n=1 Tax=Microctonus aethiopoides TaxID=144406 RepID=A0AA39C4D6_9HYME|nr:hypothetical protein PV325_011348 [Microctonus aethiopoides]KAK0157659.1 hypothetical protein PV328_011370 [Microctonus aethiopoides]
MGECYTNIEKCQTEYKWTIQQFNSHLEICENFMEVEGINLQSPEFYTEIDGHRTTWNLQVFFNGLKAEHKDWISFQINCSSEMDNNIIGLYNIYIVKGNGMKVLVCKSNKLIGFKKISTLLINQFFEKKAILKENDLLPHDTLTIICEVVILGEPITTPGPKPITYPKYALLEDYQKLFNTRVCSDVIFIVGDRKITAHKAILIARSVVFSTMLKDDKMNRSREYVVNITDMRPNVFHEFLRFIYTNEIFNLNEFNKELLFAADKYQIELLKEICEYSLYKCLDVENAAKTLVLADDYVCPQLVVHTINFINKYGLEVINTLGYKAMEISHPHLVTAIYKALLIDRSTLRIEQESIKKCSTPISEMI